MDFFASLRRKLDEPADQQTGLRAQAWAEVGFARPLSGLLTLLSTMLLLIGPYFAIQSLLSGRVQPFPEADGLWRYTVDLMFIVWLTFDMGTQTAFVKYFAEHRTHEQAKALADVQFYVWYQIFARLIEASLLLGLAFGYLPTSRLAIYAPCIVLSAAIKQPAFMSLGKFLCQALQRFDYYTLLDLIESRLLAFVVPMPFVLLGRAYGRAHPALGEAYGAALGLGIGGYVSTVLVLIISLLALRRLGVPLGSLFLAQFDAGTAKRQLWFGFKVTLPQEPYRLTSFVEQLIILNWLSDFPTWLGIRDLLHNRLTFLFYFAWSYYQSAVPAISEALGADKKTLCRYYIERFLQFGFLYSMAIFALLTSVGPIFVQQALGPQWAKTADFLVLASLPGLLLPAVWLTDMLQQGAGRPGLTAIVQIVEQGARLLLLLLLIPRFQFAGMYYAALVTLLAKCVLGWTLNQRLIVRLSVSLWPTIGAPAVAGVLIYGLLATAGSLLHLAGTAQALLWFFAAGAVALPLAFFFYGLAGGLDDAALGELHKAADMPALVGPLCRILSGAAEKGARLSPLHRKSSPLAEAAAIEARELQEAARLAAAPRLE